MNLAFDNNMKYSGTDLAVYYGIETTSDCMQACLNYNGCSNFTYAYASKDCYLKNGVMVRNADSSYTSGPKMDYLYQGRF